MGRNPSVKDTDIIVTTSTKVDAVMIRTKNPIFNEGAIVYEIKDDCLYIRKPYLDEEGSICSTKLPCGWFRCVIDYDIPIGTYEEEDDSTEDVKIFYLLK
jgi:hypothetical protein